MQVKELLEVLNDIAPMSMAEDYDNPGLLVGDRYKDVRTIMLALDLTEEILLDAKNTGVDVIITHHPIIFDPIKHIDTGTVEGRIISELIKSDICCIAMHTNLDKCKNGLNDYLAELVGIKNLKLLEDMTECYQISVYTPKDSVEAVKQAMFAAGAGSMEGYEWCSFETDGLGQFKPLNGSTPYIGEQGKVERVEESKLEMYCDANKLGGVIYAMTKAHPYEHPVYYAIKSRAYGEYGFGRYGELEREMPLKEYCEYVKSALNLPILGYTGNKDKLIRTVGVCSGAGGSMYTTAERLGLDAFITGDIKHNIGVLAAQSNTALLDAGHYGTEVVFKNLMFHHLQNRFNELQYSVNIIYSKVEKSPWSYV